MSTALRDRLITAGKTYARKRKDALTNSDLTEAGKQKALEEAQKEFDAVAKTVTSKVHTSATTLPAKKKKAEQESAAGALLELKEELAESTDPSMTVLNLVMRGEQKITSVIASDEGRKLIQKAMEKRGLVGQEAERTVTQLQTAAEKRNGQQQHVTGSSDDREGDTETRFYNLALTTFAKDVESSIEKGFSVVYFPAVPGSNDAPELVDLGGEG